jgi:hypothetical protein
MITKVMFTIGVVLVVAGPLFLAMCLSSRHPIDRKLSWIGVVAFVLGVWLAWDSAVMRGFSYSDGMRVGYVTKLSKKGVLFPTWEGEMQIGGINAEEGGSVGGRTWEFSVSSDPIATELMRAMETGKRLKLAYTDYGFRGWSWGSTTYDITAVKE